MAKILVFGYYGFGNFGDELLLASIKENLTEHDLVVVSEDPQNTEKLHGLESISRNQFWKDPGKHDIFLLGGGSILQNVTSHRSLAYYLMALKRAQKAGMDLYLMSQGIGPIRGSIANYAVSSMLKGLPLTVRDFASLIVANDLGLEAHLVADLAFGYSGYPLKNNGDMVGVAIKDGFEIDKGVAWLKTFEREIRLLAFHKDDLNLCLKVEKLLPHAHTVRVKELKDLAFLTDLEFLWGMRLHSLVVAVSMGIPAIGISYDPKIRALCRETGLAWHLPGELPKKEWIRSGKADTLICRSDRAWQLFREYTEARTPWHSR